MASIGNLPGDSKDTIARSPQQGFSAEQEIAAHRERYNRQMENAGWRVTEPERSEADKFLEASENMVRAQDKEESNLLRKQTGLRIDLNLRPPKDIFRSALAPSFEWNEVPGQIAYLAWHFSQATGFDISGTLVAGVVAAASMTTDRYRLLVRPQSNWSESARLWAVLIGNPSVGKSPSIDAATSVIKVMHEAEHRNWWTANKDKPKEERTPEPALYTSDTTVEAMVDILMDNQRGILMLTGEFDSWIGNIDSTDKAQAARNRGQWLELYDGGSRQVNRVGRGRMMVPNWSASVLAGGTPDGLRKHLRGLPQDGLIHRFIPVLMSAPNFNANGDAREAIATWWETLYQLRAKTGLGREVRFSAEAQQGFDIEEKHKRYLADAIYEASPALASHLGKHPGMLARVALTFHALIEPDAECISTSTLSLAVLFCRKVAKHWATMADAILSTSQALSIARALARSIVADSGVLTTIGRTWMSDHCAEFKKAEDRDRLEAVHILEDADWIEPTAGRTSYGGWPRQWNINQKLWHLYSKEGEAWRARREAVKDAIGLKDPDDL